MGTPTTHRRDIDGLRAIAVLGVLAFHAAPSALPGGFTGVDVFFVISGYLITGTIDAELARGAFSFRAFYARRVRRIFPALAVVLAACLGLGYVTLLAVEYAALGTHVLAGAGFASNLMLWDEAGYFDGASAAKPLLHLWSLGIEEQFYLAWPLVAWATARVRWAPRVVAGALLAGSFVVGLLHLGPHPTEAFYAPFDRAWELMIGALLARAPAASDRARGPLALVGAALVVASLIVTREADFPGAWPLLPTLGAAALIAAGPASALGRRALGHPALGWIGQISYPLYLWHWPLLAFLGIVEGRPLPAWARLLAVGASVALAALTQRFVERPLRFGRQPRLATLGLVGAMVALGCAGLAIAQRDGLPDRAIQADAPTFAEFGYTASPGCLDARPYIGPLGLCYASPRAHREAIMIVGDSHAEALAPAFIERQARGALPWDLVIASQAGCFPFVHTETYDAGWTTTAKCGAFGDGAIGEALGDPRVTTVVLVGRYSARVMNSTFGDEEWAPGAYRYDDGAVREDRPAQVFELGLAATLRRLTARGIRVVFLDQTPELGFHPSTCVRRPRLSRGGEEERCGLPRAVVMERQRVYREAVARVLREFPTVIRVDPTPLFCDDATCSPWHGDEMRYHDDDHLSPVGARAVAELITTALGESAPAR